MENNDVYRASIAALIVNQKCDFLMLELTCARPGELDFAKGGMIKGEEQTETLERELREELGMDFEYQIIEKSDWGIVYDWPPEIQKKKGFRGQARVNYWVYYTGGKIVLKPDEVRAYKWVPETKLHQTMLDSGFPETHCQHLAMIWQDFKKAHLELFNV
jgi:8-oxo-dGTP pyrophosphatase MutT (NUDIX family)